MENFEYSILLNDRDWAEFCLASEECRLVLPALATAEEQVLSDLEEGEAEENRSIRVRVGPALPVHDTASCLSRTAPDARLFAEDILSGSEDETDLGSVSRFLCSSSSSINSHHQTGAGIPQPCCTGQHRLPCAASKPPKRQCGETELNTVFAAKEGGTGRGEGPVNPGCPSAAGAASPLPEENLQEQCPGHQGGETPACPADTSLESTEEMEKSTREKEDAPLGSECPLLKEESVSVAASLPTSVKSTAVFGKAELPSVCTGSPLSRKPGRSEDPEEKAGPFQAVSRTEARPLQEKPSMIREQLLLAGKAPAPQDPGPKRHGESPPERASQAESKATGRKKGGDNRKVASCPILEDRHPAGHGRFSPRDKVEQPIPGGPEGNVPPNLAQAADSSCDQTLNKHRETAASAGTTEEGNSKEHCHHLGRNVPVQEGPYPATEGLTRSELGREPILYGLAVEASPESNFTDITLPEMYDYFFGDDDEDDTRGGGKPGDRDPSFYTATELPNLDGPEMYEYFFREMDTKKKDPRDNAAEIFLSSDHPSAPPSSSKDPTSEAALEATRITIPEVYEHFFAGETRDRRNWRGVLLSLPAAEAKKAVRALKSLLCRPARYLCSQPTRHKALLRRSSQGKLVLLSTLRLEESQLRPEDGKMALMRPAPIERPLPVQPILTPRDMCLGFVAFASWAVKTSDLQAPDAWKIVLLANFGSLSAIRYFRRQVVIEGPHGT